MSQETTDATLDLADLTSFIRRALALNLPEPVWVAAEISQANVSRENCWLTLVQKNLTSDAIVAQLDGVVWRGDLARLRRKYGVKIIRDLFQTGMSVRLRVATNFHERYGLRLTVEDIDPAHTIGLLEQRRQETLDRLSKEGLLSKNGQLPLPVVCQRLAVISSDTAAGLADFREQLTNNGYGYSFSLRLFPAAMQGQQTGPEVSARLRQIQRSTEPFDAVVIVRGGGGRTDLAAFDDEDLARQVAACTLPVLTGIGHETDNAVLDAVAHTSLKTPTATAVYLIDRLVRAEGLVLRLGRSIEGQAATILRDRSQRLAQLTNYIDRNVRTTISSRQQRLASIENQLNLLPSAILNRAATRLTGYEQLLAALRPEAALARGYALVSQDGRIVTDPEELSNGDVDVRLAKGRVTLTKAE